MTDLAGMSTEQLLALYNQQQPPVDAATPPATAATPPAATLTADQLLAAGQQRQQGDQPLAWSDVPGQAIRNLPSSAYQFGSDIVQPFLHPVETLSNIGTVGQGLAQKLGVSIGENDPNATAAADAVGQYFTDRYGSMEGFKRALASDPVGVAGDLSTVVSGGSTALARAPGVVGRAGRVAGTAARAIDPLTLPTAAGGLALRSAAGLSTGVGGDVLNAARSAARESREGSIAVRDYMRSNAPLEEIVSDAQSALDQMRQAKQAAYRQDMRALARDKTILSWNDVDTALNDMNKVASYKGQPVSRSTEAVRNRIINEIDNWKNLRASEYWTPEGFDALKKSIGDIANDIPYENRAARLVAKQAYDAVKNTIVKQAPGYAGTMQAYERASNAMRELQTTFSLNPDKPIDTALRKLTSAMRNNVNTNFGRRTQLLDQLEQQSPGLKAKITGASLSSWEPRGIGRVATAGAGLAQLGSALASGGLLPLATIPAQLAASSPRLMGEVARGVGSAQRYAGYARPRALAELARQEGRTEEQRQRPRVYINTSEFR